MSDDVLFDVVLNRTSIIAQINEPVEIFCIINGSSGPYKIEWLKCYQNDPITITSNDTSCSICLNDAGMYSIYLSVTDSKGTLITKAIEIKSVDLTISVVPENITVSKGSSCVFTAIVNNESANVEWIKSNNYRLEMINKNEVKVTAIKTGEHIISAYAYNSKTTVIASAVINIVNDSHIIVSLWNYVLFFFDLLLNHLSKII